MQYLVTKTAMVSMGPKKNSNTFQLGKENGEKRTQTLAKNLLLHKLPTKMQKQSKTGMQKNLSNI